MASDFDLDWGDDPFGGDVDFDMDFNMDPFKGKGFIRSVATGFLSGVVDETVGSGDARMRSLRTILPSTFSTALDKASFVGDRLKDLATEFREENAESAKSLQTIASHLNQKMGSKLPGFVQNGLGNFSSKDFSSWERLSEGGDKFTSKVGDTDDSDVEDAIDRSVNAQSAMFAGLGESLNSMAAVVGSNLQSAIGAGNRQLVNIESGVRDLLNYQRNVQARIDQGKLSLMARSYIQDTKFHKFMEAGIHAEVAELKRIAKYVSMSEYEKTTTLTATKDFMRKSIFNTVGKRVGGLSGLIGDRFSQQNRKGAYGAIGDLLGNVADGLDMSGDVGMSRGMLGNILGKMVAGVAVDKLPMFFSRGPGKRVIDQLSKKYPEQAGYLKEQVKQLTDMGNVVSYASTSGVGMLNYMAENYQPIDEMKYVDYEDYLDQLPPGKKALPKAAWTAVNAASNKAKEGINKLMAETTRTRGTQYTITRRNAKDLNKPGIWKEMNNITLNEVLPGLISKTNLLLEKMHTGNDATEQVSYNYMRGEFQKDSDRRITTQADLMPHSEFSRLAKASLEMVDSLDPDKLLSGATRKAFAKQVAKDIDADKGFNPYYYLGDIPGISSGAQKEIHAALKRHFGIEDHDVAEFNSGDGLARMKKMSYMPSEQGRERLNKTSSAAQDIKTNFPNVAERIDLLRQTGNEQMLRDLGVIYTENGIDKINVQIFHDRLGQYMDDPNNPALKGATPKPSGPAPGRKGGSPFGNNPPPIIPPSGGLGGGSSIPGEESFSSLTAALTALTDRLGAQDATQGGKVDWDPMTGAMSAIKDSNQGILEKTTEMALMFGDLMELAKAGKLFTGGVKDKSEEREEETAKRSIMDKLKGAMPANALGKGFDFIAKNNPLILGGLLGGVASKFMSNPVAAGATLGLGLMAGGYVQWKNRQAGKATGDTPSDDEDILDESGEPLLKSAKLKLGQYIDAATKKVISTWGDVRGPIIDTTTKAIIGAKELAGKIFGADGRALALRGLAKARDAAVGAYNFLDPISRIKSTIQMGKEIVYQQDVFSKGDLRKPLLKASGFKAGDYFVREENGNFKAITGWNEITGPVYDNEGNQLVTEDEYNAGLVTATGAAVRNVGGAAASVAGGVAGLGRAGINKLLGRFGYAQGTNEPGAVSPGKSAGSNGVEKRLDKIYRLLCQHFEIPGEIDPDSDEGSTTGALKEGGLRLNSLAWKEKKKEKDEKHKVNEAIIHISESMGGGSDKGEKKEGGGLFDKLKGLALGAGSFAMKLIKNPIGAIGSLLLSAGSMVIGSTAASIGRLAKIGGALFSGVLGAASPIYKLLKFGFTSLAKVIGGAVMGRRGAGGLDDLGGPDQRGQGGRRRRNGRRTGGGRSKFRLGSPMKMALGAGLAYGASEMMTAGEDDYDGSGKAGTYDVDANEPSRDIKNGERDPVTGHYRLATDTAVDMVTDWLPSGMLAKAAVTGGMDKDTKDKWDNYGVFWSSDKKFFIRRDEMEAHEDEIKGIAKNPEGYGDVKLPNPTTQRGVRYVMYGTTDQTNSFGRRIGMLEQMLYPYVVIRNNRASFKDNTPIEKIITDFANSDPGQLQDKGAVGTWFVARFKPIFLVFNAAVSVARMGDLTEFDNARSYEVVQVLERVQQTIATLDPFPYSIDVKVDSKSATLPDVTTRQRIAELMDILKKNLPAPNQTVEKIASSATAKATDAAKQAPKETGPTAEMGAQDALGRAAAKASQQAADITQPEQVKSIDISDEMPGGDKEMDPFVMTRLAVYGNIDNMSWRVEAVLRLERYMESYIMVMGEQARFTGKSNQVMELFKPSFRLNSKAAEMNWLTWFRDRFLPTLMTYMVEIHKLRGTTPERGWKQLTATNRAKIARMLTEQHVSVDDKQTNVWAIAASPFPNSKSGEWSDRADKYLKILDAKAQEARLKDPEMEDEKSKGTSGDDPIQKAQAAKVKDNTAKMLNEVYGGNSNAFKPSGFSGANATSMNGAAYPNATMSLPGGAAGSAGQFMGKADNNFNPEFLKKAGEDKGIKMSPAQGEKLMLNHLVKAGFTDNKVLALALAMAKKETGNYQNTVENTNWSAPTLLKYFKNIPDEATAQKVAAMSPAERAMWVYGRAPKGPALGNSKPEDGWDYRGRGFFQLTGKANYEKFKKETGIDVVGNPKLVSEDPNVMAESAVRFLKNNKAMLSIAQTGDFDTAVRGINGGNAVPATDERRQYYNEYLQKLRNGDLDLGGAEQTAAAAPAPTNTPPAAADQNVPDGAAATDTPIATPTGKNAVTDLLKQSDKESAPSNVGAPPSPASSPSGSANLPAGDVVGDTNSGPSGPVNQSVSSAGQPGVTPPPQSTPAPVSTPVAKETKQAAPAPAQAVPEHIATTDVATGKLLVEANKHLANIAQILGRQGKGSSLVNMS